MAFTCPECGAVSHHPEDERNGYCGRCCGFTEDLHSWLRCLDVELAAGDISREVYERDRAFYRSVLAPAADVPRRTS